MANTASVENTTFEVALEKIKEFSASELFIRYDFENAEARTTKVKNTKASDLLADWHGNCECCPTNDTAARNIHIRIPAFKTTLSINEEVAFGTLMEQIEERTSGNIFSKAELRHIKSAALCGAKKLCGNGTCNYDLGCGHANNKPQWPKHRADATCPLAKYNITPLQKQKPWWDQTAKELYIDRNEIFALCVECENSELRMDADGVYVHRKNLDRCLDCPVKGAEEAMDENAAEM